MAAAVLVLSAVAAAAYAAWFRQVTGSRWSAAATLSAAIPVIALLSASVPEWPGLPVAAVAVLSTATAGAWHLNRGARAGA